VHCTRWQRLYLSNALWEARGWRNCGSR